jgi:hypothetical protein
MNVPDDPTDLSPFAGKVGGTRFVPWIGSFVVLVEINEIFPVPIAGNPIAGVVLAQLEEVVPSVFAVEKEPLTGLPAQDVLSAVGLTCPMGFSPRLNSIRLSEDLV